MRPKPACAAALVMLAGLLQLVVAGCTTTTAGTSCGGPAYTLHVLAGSDLDDMTPVLAQAARATGVTVSPGYVGSITGAQEVVNGTAAFAIHAADGTPMAIAGDREVAIAAIQQHEMVATQVH